MTQDTDFILARLERLEKGNYRWKRGALAALVFAGALVVMGQAAPRNRVIQAEKFVLQDTSGRARASLKLTELGPSFSLYDEKGTERAELSLHGDTPGLALADSHGKTRTSISVDSTGPGLSMVDSSGKQRLALYVAPSGSVSVPLIELYDADGKVLWTAAPAAAVPAFASTGIGDVCVESYPSDAEVFVDGQPIGQAPAALRLPLGDHLIEAKLPGHETWQRRIHVLPESNTTLKAYWEQPVFSPKTCAQH